MTYLNSFNYPNVYSKFYYVPQNSFSALDNNRPKNIKRYADYPESLYKFKEEKENKELSTGKILGGLTALALIGFGIYKGRNLLNNIHTIKPKIDKKPIIETIDTIKTNSDDAAEAVQTAARTEAETTKKSIINLDEAVEAAKRQKNEAAATTSETITPTNEKAINNLDEAVETAETKTASTNTAQTIKKVANEADDEILSVQKRFEELTGRNLDFTGEISRKTDYNAEYLNMDLLYGVDATIMEITRKARYKKLAEFVPYTAKKIKENPSLVALDEETTAFKKAFDKQIEKAKPTEFDSIEFRGETYRKDDYFYKMALNLKKGDIYEHTGYMWTTPTKKYLENYGGDVVFKDINASIRYNLLFPKGSKMIFQDKGEFARETILPENSKFRVLDVIKDENGNIEFFMERLV